MRQAGAARSRPGGVWQVGYKPPMAGFIRLTRRYRLSLLLVVTLAVLVAGQGEGVAQDPPPPQEEKDAWDKLDAVSGLVSGALVALIGGLATYLYNERQRSAQAAERARELGTMEVQTVAGFLPHLHSGNPQEKEAALVAMSALGNTALVTRLAAIYRDDASVGALSRIAAGADAEAAVLAESSLEQILSSAVVELASEEEGATQFRSTGFAVAPGFIVTADYLGEDLERALVKTVDGKSHSAAVVGRDANHGIMVLKVEGAELGTLRLLEEGVTPEDVGELTLLGWGASGWRYSLGQLQGRKAGETFSQSGLMFLQAKIATEPGHGGAPVVDRAGSVVAMHYARDTNPEGERMGALLVPADTIRAGLIALGVPMSA